MACSSNCPTQNHQTYGECLRSKGLQVADATAHKYHAKQNSDLDAYVSARHAGLQPQTVFRKDVERAWKITDKTGVPYRADQ